MAVKNNNMSSDYRRYRFYEILPGLSIWGTLLAALFLAFFKPIWMIYGIIVFDVYWAIRVFYFSFYVILSWRRFRRALKTNWVQKLYKECDGKWQQKKNVIFLPMYNESFSVVSETLSALSRASFPAKEIYVVIAGEARKQKHWEEVQVKVKEKFNTVFADLIFYTHPEGLAGEIPGKGSNINYAEKKFKKYADDHGWSYGDIIVSVFDVDTVVHPEYFAHLTYLYCLHPDPTRSSFQPVTLYNNNLWDSPAILRIMAFGTTFWMMFSLARLDNLVTFSSHSMSFQAIIDCDGHAKNIVSEDSHIFFQCWLKNSSNYEVTPLYIPVSMDTVRDESLWKSLKNLYLQQRRWAWGTENIPFLLWEFKKHPEIKWYKKFALLFHEWEGKWSWGVVAILLTFLGRIPLWVASEEVRQSALFFNTPYVLENLMSLAMIGMFISAILSMLLLPPRPESHKLYKYLFMVVQWALLPVSMILFSAIPCLDAVTHLMFGKYLGFNVSAKKRAT